jgi:hypothetical protein
MTSRPTRVHRTTVGVRLIAVLAGLLLATTAGAAAATPRTSGTALELLALLRTAGEHPGGYDRTLFRLWVDADEDGCSTRDEVLIAEAVGTAEIGDDCTLTGTWRSAYDGATTTDPSSFDIDHVVPLKEAWDSGAWAWSAMQRRRYANDLGDWRSLRAVTATSNRSKADKDPAQWLPPLGSFHCQYATEWIVVKVRWSLKVDARERAKLRDILAGCPVHTVRVAILALTAPAPTPSPSPTPMPTPTPIGAPTPTPTPVASPTPGATPLPTPTPTPTPTPV